jgi:membrane protease YdiL (CAAX protease family)
MILFTKRGEMIKWKNSLITAGIITFLFLLSIINFIPSIWFKYNTAIPLKIYFAIIGVVLFLIGTFMFGCFVLIFGVGDRLTNITWNKPLISFLNGFSYLKTKEFGKKVLIGYCWGGILIGFIFWFYFICRKFENIWIFMTPTILGSLPSYLPFLLPITIGIISAFGEEFIFRAISISLFKKWFRYSLIAIILSAFIWGLGHVTIEIYPIYFRIIEITIVGIVLAILFLKFGIEVTIAAHFFINSFAFSCSLINLSLPYLKFSGLTAIIITLLPLIILFFKNPTTTVSTRC